MMLLSPSPGSSPPSLPPFFPLPLVSAWEINDDYLPAALSPSLPLSPGSITNKSPCWERGPEETRGTKPLTEPFFPLCSPKQLCISLGGQASPRPAGEKEGGEGGPSGFACREQKSQPEDREKGVVCVCRSSRCSPGPDPASGNRAGLEELPSIGSPPCQGSSGHLPASFSPLQPSLCGASPSLCPIPTSQRILLGRSPGVFHEP